MDPVEVDGELGEGQTATNLTAAIRGTNEEDDVEGSSAGHPGLRESLRESWIGGVRIVGLPSSAELSSVGLSSSTGLQDYEDTRLKTSSRVRMGLSLAWKASLAIRIRRSPTIVTDSM